MKPGKQKAIYGSKCVRTTVSMPESYYRDLERIADQKKVSIAWVVRDAVESYLTQQLPLFFKREP
jgi:hypothetical protein